MKRNGKRKQPINIFPTVNKRPNAKVVLESTPGRAGSHHEQMWQSSLEGNSRFTPVFLEWWRDDSCRIVANDLNFKPDEVEYQQRHKDMGLASLAFRQRALGTEFVGDARLFSSKYPSDPYDGWLGSTNPVMPADLLKPALAAAKPDPPMGMFNIFEIDKPLPDTAYLITADPAGFGSTGDNRPSLCGIRLSVKKLPSGKDGKPLTDSLNDSNERRNDTTWPSWRSSRTLLLASLS